MDRGYFLERKRSREPFAMVTCYDYPFARMLDAAGVEIAFVGDSVGTNVLGYASVHDVTVDDMVHHTRAVRRGIESALLVADLPSGSFSTVKTARETAARLKDAGADMLKLEGETVISDQVEALVGDGYRVMVHIGFTPQFHGAGETVVKGRPEAEASRLFEAALGLEAVGAELLLMECVVADLARRISEALTIPTVGIGSGAGCDGQVLVLHDLLGISGAPYRFVREYADVRNQAISALRSFREDVRNMRYPSISESFR